MKKLLFLLPLFLLGCEPKAPEPATGIRHTQWFSMGTAAAVSVPEADAGAIDDVRKAVQTVFDQIESDLSLFKPDSTVSRINAAAGTDEIFTLSPSLSTCIYHSWKLWRESGVFSPLLKPLMAEAWGFYADHPPQEAPAKAMLEPFLRRINPNFVFDGDLQGNTFRLAIKGAALDLGGIAKGAAVDAAYEALLKNGTTSALIDLGGNLRAIGLPRPKAKGWNTGIRNPFNGEKIIGMFPLYSGEGVATSGNYERFVTIAGKRYAHILDPRTGMPVTGMAGVTVIAPTAIVADGLSTTLFILGPEEGLAFLKKNNRDYAGVEALWIPDNDSHEIFVTPGFKARITLSDNAFTLKELK